jgi:type IV secretory pathway VirJ component
MTRDTFLSFSFVFFFAGVALVTDKLPIKEWNSTSDKPLIFYVSGDGGYTGFSENICTAINKTGYKITALNSKAYFNDQKTPEQTTKDIVVYLNTEFNKRKSQQLVLAGYSFGADIVPFVSNILPDSLKKKLIGVVLLSPSTSTDFETHIWDMLGGKKKRSRDVVAEINKLGAIKTAIILENETDFPVNEIKLKNCDYHKLAGGHHFEGNTNEVVKTMLKYF